MAASKKTRQQPGKAICNFCGAKSDGGRCSHCGASHRPGHARRAEPNPNNDADLRDAIEVFAFCGHDPADIARKLHLRPADVQSILRTGDVPKRQKVLWASEVGE